MGWPYQQKPPMGWPLDYDSGLVPEAGFWPMLVGSGNTVYDLSGNGGTGTRYGTGTIWTPGEFGSAQLFDGSTDYILVASNPALVSAFDEHFTIIVAASTPVTNSKQRLFGKPYTSHNIPYYQVRLNFWDDSTITANITQSEEALDYLTVASSYSANQTYHIAMTCNVTTPRLNLYVDGILRASDTSSDGAYTNHNTSIGFGSRVNSPPARQLTGTIHYALIYNRVLSASEIALLASKPFYMFKDPAEIALLGGYQEEESPEGIVILRRRMEAA